MTIEDWWDKDETKLKCIWCEKEEAALAWDAATTAERQRCREIALKMK